MRETLASHKELAGRLNELETRLGRRLDGHDHAIREVLGAIRQLMTPPEPPRRRGIGFLPPDQYDFGSPSTRSAMKHRIICGLTGAMRPTSDSRR
jgi:hypothetical protein